MSYLTKAIFQLAPDAEFSFENDDYATINWIVEPASIPTAEEIDAAIEEIKQNEANVNAQNQAAKAALLERLGITAEEAKLLLK